MDSIKINIVLPKASELKTDLNTLLNQVQGKTKFNLELDISEFKTSIGEVSQLLGKLKTQVSSLGGFETLINNNLVRESTKAIKEQSNAIKEQQKILDERVLKTSSTKVLGVNGGEDKLINDLTRVRDEYGNIIDVITNYNRETGAVNEVLVKNTNEIEKQRLANEKLVISTEKIKDAMQLKLNDSLSNKNFSLIDDSVFTSLQQKINNINTDTPEREIRELQNALKNLNNSDSQIVRLQNAISKYEAKITGLKDKYKNLVPKNELNEAISKITELKNVLSQVQNNEGLFTNKAISNSLNEASTSMNKLGTATKIASDQQRLYNKEVVTFKSAFSDIAAKVGLFSVVYSAVNKVQSEFKNGVQSVIDMNTALSNLNKVFDLSENQLISMRNSAVSMGEALGKSSIEIANTQSEFARLYKDIDTINSLTEIAIKGANTMDGLSADKVASGLTTIISSMELKAEDAIDILNSLNEIQNNFKIQSNELLNGLAEVGSVAKTSGVNLEELAGYITSIQIATGASGQEIGTSLNSIFSRVYKSYSVNALDKIGVSVKDLEGNFRSISDILVDLNGKWQTMNETEKITLSQTVGGTNRYNELISLMNNFDVALDATGKAMDSFGSIAKENEIYLDSIEGKMNSLKASTEAFWFDFIDSDMIKGGVDALQSLMNVLNGLQGAFGSLSLTVGGLTSAFLIFTNNPLKQLSQDIVFHKTTLGGLSDIYNQVKYAVKETGANMNVAQKSSLALRTGYDLLGKTAFTTQLKVVALQTALSLGVSVAISLAVSMITKLVSSLNASEKSMENVETQANTLSQALDSVAKERDLSVEYEKIGRLLEEGNLEQGKSIELQKQLDTITQDLISSEDEYYWILKSGNLTLDERIEKMNQIRERKLFDEAKELDDDMMSQKDIEKKVKMLNEYVTSYNNIQKAIETGSKTGNYQNLIDLIGVSDIDEANKILKETKNKINELDGEVLKYNSSVLKMGEANYETDRSTIQINKGLESFIKIMNEATTATDENTKAKEGNSNFGVEDEVANMEELAKAYTDSLKEMEKMYSLQEKINAVQSMTPALVTELLETYPHLGASVNDVAYVQEFLNKKISEQQTISANANKAMIENDATYFNNKIKNTSEYEKYTIEVLNSIKDANIDYYNKNIDGMQNELKNAQTLAQARAVLEQNLVNSLAGLWSDYYKTLSSQWYTDRAVYQYAPGKGTALYDETNKILTKQNEIATKAKELADKFSNFSSSAFIPYVSGDFSSLGTSGGSSGTSASEKEVENMETLYNRYLEVENALKKLDNELKINKTLMDQTSGEDKISYLNKELELIKKQEQAYKSKLAEEKKEIDEVKKRLNSSGFNFNNMGDIANYSRISSLTEWANGLSGESKENAQKNVKAIYDDIQRYNELLLEQIPELNNKILELKTDTLDAQKEILSIMEENVNKTITNIDKEISKMEFNIEINGGLNATNTTIFKANIIKLEKEKLDALNKTLADYNKITVVTKEQQIALNEKMSETKDLIAEQEQEIRKLAGAYEQYGLDLLTSPYEDKMWQKGTQQMNKVDLALQTTQDKDTANRIALTKQKLEIQKAMVEDTRAYLEKLRNTTTKTTEGYQALIEKLKEAEEELYSQQTAYNTLNKELESFYKEKLNSVATVENQISEIIKKNAEDRINKEKEALDKSIENDKKRIDSKKKALSEEKELYNKKYSEDNYQSSLNEERNKLLQIQAEIDKLQFATDRASQQKLESLMRDYEAQQKAINDKISEHQNQAINDRFDEEQKMLDKELEDKQNVYEDAIKELDKKLENFLKPENLTNLVTIAMNSGFVDILGQTTNLNDAMQEMLKESEVGVANLNIKFNDWLDKLTEIKGVANDIGSLMKNAGLDSSIKLSGSNDRAIQSLSIDMGGINIEGNVDKDILPDIEKMLKKQQEETISVINKRLSGAR